MSDAYQLQVQQWVASCDSPAEALNTWIQEAIDHEGLGEGAGSDVPSYVINLVDEWRSFGIEVTESDSRW